MTEAKPRESPESDNETTIVNRIFFVIGWVMSTAVILNTALLFSRRSAIYEWMNRLGVFMFFALILAFLVWGFANTGRRRWDGTRANAWAFRASALIGTSLILFKLWDRILDALWLR
jgi:protein-S-isoprenylcysteine O-methyltransferase Ste14